MCSYRTQLKARHVQRPYN